MATAEHGTDAPRSRLITMVAWLSIVLCALCALTCVVDTLALAAMADNEGLQAALGDPSMAGLVSPELAAVVRSGAVVPWFAVVTAACIAGLVVSIALLRRREWGRRLFVWLVLAAIPLTWAGAIAAQALGWPALLVVVSYLFAVVVTGVHLWLVRELNRDTVRAEFCNTRTEVCAECGQKH